MKKHFLLLSIFAGLLLSVFFVSCEKELEKGNTTKPTSKVIFSKSPLILEYGYDTISYTFTGKNLDEQLSMFQHNLSLNEERYLGDVTLNTSSISLVEVYEIHEDKIILSVDNQDIYTFEILANTNSNLKMNITVDGERDFIFSYKNENDSIPDLLEKINPGQYATYQAKLPILPFAFGVACLIAQGVDMVCDRRIANQVAECTEAGQCSKVNSCSADCVKCGNPD